MIKKALIFSFFLGINLFANFQMEEEVKKVNEEIIKLKKDLKEKTNKVDDLYKTNATDSEYKNLLDEIKKIKQNIQALEENFKKEAINESIKIDEGYAFWDQGETTISQLVMEYGSQDYLYIIPQELALIKLNMYSTIPIPRQSWDELMEFILTHNGIGIKKNNPFLRELFILKQDPSYIDAIISKAEDLNRLKEGSIICYIFSPPVDQLRSVQGFLERFCDIKQITIHPIKTNIVAVGSKETISRLVNLYDAVFKNAEGKIIKVVSLTKINPQDADKILQAFFSQNQKSKPSYYQGYLEDLSVIAQDSSVILIGEASLVEKAENVISDLEKQLDDPSEMTIFWYTCKNSDPQDLADILEKIYVPMSGVKMDEKIKLDNQAESNKFIDAPKNILPVKPKFFEPGKIYPIKENQPTSSNFVVDAKTGSLLMVVKKTELPKLKTLLKKLDEPKKMVQIDVLLVERKVQDRKQTGINLLKIGNASNKKETALDFDSGSTSKRKGILDFILSRPRCKLPSFDLTLSFLMAQDDMHIADCPSIIAVNQTPATISVVDEISINNGAVQIDTSSGPKLEKSFTRAQFGTTIVMTPIIHLPDEDSENSEGFVTLHTDVSFDTTKSKDNDKPAVTRRHIENEVRVADGQTIILGGLRRKTDEEGSEKIPFLGEIPGIGKLFGTTRHSSSTSEMFIFITPHIIKDPKVDLENQRKYFLQKRQGDTDDFVKKLEEAKTLEKQKLFEESLKLFF
jgi:general secretion pathway protein D